jgi:hypothetical protein
MTLTSWNRDDRRRSGAIFRTRSAAAVTSP